MTDDEKEEAADMGPPNPAALKMLNLIEYEEFLRITGWSAATLKDYLSRSTHYGRAPKVLKFGKLGKRYFFVPEVKRWAEEMLAAEDKQADWSSALMPSEYALTLSEAETQFEAHFGPHVTESGEVVNRMGKKWTKNNSKEIESAWKAYRASLDASPTTEELGKAELE